jgi:hypothetical protein
VQASTLLWSSTSLHGILVAGNRDILAGIAVARNYGPPIFPKARVSHESHPRVRIFNLVIRCFVISGFVQQKSDPHGSPREAPTGSHHPYFQNSNFGRVVVPRGTWKYLLEPKSLAMICDTRTS